MSVIVKGMEMPKNCKECPFSDHQAWCLIPGEWRERYYCPDDDVSEHCPLVEIPTPHGRLIDADAIDYRNDAMHDGRGNLVVEDNFVSGIMWINDCINETKAIMEEEKDEVVS